MINNARVVITTNADDDGRWEGLKVFQCSPEKCGDHAYFRNLVQVYFADPANRRAVFDFLLARTVS